MRYWSRSTAVLATVGAVASLTLVSAPAAQAASSWPTRCTVPLPLSGPNLDDGWGVMKGSYNLKVTPKQSACNARRMHKGQVLYFHCWLKNTYGNLWVYGRIKGTRKHGWMSMANFRSIHSSSYPKCDWNKSKDHT